MKKIARIVSVLFVVGGLALLFGQRAWFPDFYNPIFMGLMGFVSAFLVCLPRLFLKPKNTEQEKVVDMIQAGITFGLVLGALGALGFFQLYEIGIQYDKIVHFLNSFIFTIVLTRSLQGWRNYDFKKSLSWSILIVFLGGIVWEGYELFGDTLFGTQMLGHYGEFITFDTNWDLIMNCLGIILGAVGLKIFKK